MRATSISDLSVASSSLRFNFDSLCETRSPHVNIPAHDSISLTVRFIFLATSLKERSEPIER